MGLKKIISIAALVLVAACDNAFEVVSFSSLNGPAQVSLASEEIGAVDFVEMAQFVIGETSFKVGIRKSKMPMMSECEMIENYERSTKKAQAAENLIKSMRENNACSDEAGYLSNSKVLAQMVGADFFFVTKEGRYCVQNIVAPVEYPSGKGKYSQAAFLSCEGESGSKYGYEIAFVAYSDSPVDSFELYFKKLKSSLKFK